MTYPPDTTEDRPESPTPSEVEHQLTTSQVSPGVPGTSLPPGRSPLWRRLLTVRARPRGIWIILAGMGPGIITANAGNDAGGIATYAQVGSTYGYQLLWMFPIILLGLAVVQEMAARMGAASGKGLSDLIRENFSIHVTAMVMLALFIANAGTIFSEFVGIAASVELLFPGVHAQYIGVPLIALAIWLMVVRGNYMSVERVFLAMTLVFFAYPISAFLAKPSWSQAAHHTVAPTVHFSQPYLLLFVATVGTSITPYMQVFVQSSVADKGITQRDYMPERFEVYLGSFFANLIAVFIVVATAATLYKAHITVTSASDAAKALQPLAGAYAARLFAVGLLGASMLAAAVLPLATAYSITEALGVEKGLNVGFREAPVFTGLFTGLMVLGVVIALIPGLPYIQTLILVQVVNCLLLPFILFSILKLVNNPRIMGDMVNGRLYNLVAWATAIIVTVLSVILLLSTVLSWFGL